MADRQHAVNVDPVVGEASSQSSVVPAPFISFAQNHEDVVLWRALGSIDRGRYVDVGASHPETDSVTKAFVDAGWSGIDIEPLPYDAELLRADRPKNVVIEAVISASDAPSATLHEVVGTGLSTLRGSIASAHREDGRDVHEIEVPNRRLDEVVQEHGYFDGDVHFLKVDVEGAEAEVLSTVDLRQWRPWILVIESTRPNSTEPTWHEWEDEVLAAGYQFCLFDGLSRFYVADEHADQLGALVSYPACPLDRYVPARQAAMKQQLDQSDARAADRERTLAQRINELEQARRALGREAVRWRAAAVESWAEGIGRSKAELEGLRSELKQARRAAEQVSHAVDAARAREQSALDELEATRHTISWRLTRPLRAVRRAAHRGSAAR